MHGTENLKKKLNKFVNSKNSDTSCLRLSVYIYIFPLRPFSSRIIMSHMKSCCKDCPQVLIFWKKNKTVHKKCAFWQIPDYCSPHGITHSTETCNKSAFVETQQEGQLVLPYKINFFTAEHSDMKSTGQEAYELQIPPLMFIPVSSTARYWTQISTTCTCPQNNGRAW
jgi:hypothetical protein